MYMRSRGPCLVCVRTLLQASEMEERQPSMVVRCSLSIKSSPNRLSPRSLPCLPLLLLLLCPCLDVGRKWVSELVCVNRRRGSIDKARGQGAGPR